jgi:hypothetical protein
MSEKIMGCLTDQHLIHFGTIIQCFVRHEVLVQEIMAAVSGADVTSIKLLTGALSFTEKREALLNLLRHRAVPIDRFEHIRNYLQMPRTYTTLRNDIAHSTWTEGLPQNSISPIWLTHGPMQAVKPVHDIGKGAKEYIEDQEDKTTYTLDDLREIGENLALNYIGFRDYIARVDLMSSPAA